MRDRALYRPDDVREVAVNVIARRGFALAYAIIVGLGALLGTLVPLFVQQHELSKGRPMIFVLSGVAVMALDRQGH